MSAPIWVRRAPLVVAALTVPLLAACGSSGPASAAKAPTPLCNRILAVLSDGPDPDADPVGYALSQILPLGQIRSSDSSVQHTLASLIVADKSLVKSNGRDKADSTTIKKDDAMLNQACPGVAS
jgi:hypothetical protein